MSAGKHERVPFVQIRKKVFVYASCRIPKAIGSAQFAELMVRRFLRHPSVFPCPPSPALHSTNALTGHSEIPFECAILFRSSNFCLTTEISSSSTASVSTGWYSRALVTWFVVTRLCFRVVGMSFIHEGKRAIAMVMAPIDGTLSDHLRSLNGTVHVCARVAVIAPSSFFSS